MTYVYMHLFPNGKVYIGIADDPEERWGNGMGYENNRAMFADIVRYGWQNIKHTILTECPTREDALRTERGYILLYDSENPEKGYNQTGPARDSTKKEEARLLFKQAAKTAGLDPDKIWLSNLGSAYGVTYEMCTIGSYNPNKRTFHWGRGHRHTSYIATVSELSLILPDAITDVRDTPLDS
jgi:predicted GIY-YIG superfamily endonuclease